MSTALITRDYNGTPFVFREDGWFNMTKAAKAFNKNLSNFWQSPDTEVYVKELARITGKGMDSSEFVETKMGRTGGTFAHPDLAVFFSRWLDVKFSVWCDMVIKDILRGAAEVTITKSEEAAALAGLQARSTLATPAGGVVAFESWTQVRAEMMKPEYRTDRAFRTRVCQRLVVSDNLR